MGNGRGIRREVDRGFLGPDISEYRGTHATLTTLDEVGFRRARQGGLFGNKTAFDHAWEREQLEREQRLTPCEPDWLPALLNQQTLDDPLARRQRHLDHLVDQVENLCIQAQKEVDAARSIRTQLQNELTVLRELNANLRFALSASRVDALIAPDHDPG